MEIEITSIEIKLKGRSIKLTAKEARRVYYELEKLFDAAKPIPYWPYPPPIIIDRNSPVYPKPWEIWCGANTGDCQTGLEAGTMSIAV